MSGFWIKMSNKLQAAMVVMPRSCTADEVWSGYDGEADQDITVGSESRRRRVGESEDA